MQIKVKDRRQDSDEILNVAGTMHLNSINSCTYRCKALVTSFQNTNGFATITAKKNYVLWGFSWNQSEQIHQL